ncbi:hypothetical protein K0B96_04675 [Horticoccus luteus]|uniref:Uncharacterized protein n=1 Tax=Horticoccus luteus TaxID=2862869 RepID=A0A8F9TXP7_9BACT|nr:hypothetical protein [Horticoccus luteus]QYM79917.1 hypothetical protein K0B96_04675 [Horticoccus luteus]
MSAATVSLSPTHLLARARIALGRRREIARLSRVHHANEKALATAPGVLPVRINAPAGGLGAHFNMAVLVLTACHERGLRPKFRFTTPHYGRPDGSYDWLAELYRQPTDLDVPPGAPEFVLTQWNDVPPSLRRARAWERAELAAFLHAHFTLAPALSATLEDYHARFMGGEPTLGLHFRGSDKHTEADPVTPAAMLEAAAALLETGSFDRVFFATDSLSFVSAIGSEFHGRPVASAPDVLRSGDLTGVHFMNHGNPVTKARQALLDALLLGRCQHLLKTESSLSQWTTLLHPSLPVTQLNRRRTSPAWAAWFPVPMFAEGTPRGA